jgi:hypothetical protein
VVNKYTLEKTEGAIKNAQSRETGNIDEENTTQCALDTTMSKQTPKKRK